MDRITDLLILGGGNMGGAIALACAAAGRRVRVVEPAPQTRQALESCTLAAGHPPELLQVAPDLASAAAHLLSPLNAGTACVILAVKPQVFPALAPELANALAGTSPIILSIMAGVTSAALEHALPGARVLRAMPNLGAAISRSTTALCAGASATPSDLERAAAVVADFGSVEHIDESLMDAFTVLAGSGPAFLFYLAEAMALCGVATGFEPDQARRIVAHTLDAGARLLLDAQPRFDAATLRARVTSKEGTTQAAMESLDAEDVMAAIARAILAGRDRGRELGK